MTRKRLGRGLSTLLGERDSQPASSSSSDTTAVLDSQGLRSEPREVELDSISHSPYQPRVEFDPEALQELAASLRNHGMLEPLLVRRDPADPNRYQLIAGERRHRAAQIAGLPTVPVTVREASDLDLLELAIVENVQREDLNPIEQAQGYRRLMQIYEETGNPLSQQQVADKVGKSRAVVANLLRLLDLRSEIQESIVQGQLSQGHGKILAGLEEDLCRKAWDFALQQRASVRQLEEFLKNEQNTEPKPERSKKPRSASPGLADPHHQYIEDALRERLRTKVHLNIRKDSSGSVTIEFFNQEDLDRLLESLGIEL